MAEFKEGRPAEDLPRSMICDESYLPTSIKEFVVDVLFLSTDWVDIMDILREAEARPQLRATMEEILAAGSFVDLHLYAQKNENLYSAR